MIRCTFLLAMLSIVLAPARGKADDIYTIKFKQAAKGDKTQFNRQTTVTDMRKCEDSQGNVHRDDNETVVEKYAYQETILEKPPEKNRATNLRRTYDLAEVTKDDEKQTLPYQGKTVLIQKKGEHYEFQVEGGKKLTGNDAQFLGWEFYWERNGLDFEKLLLPKNPVRIGEAWKLDIEALLEDHENNGVKIDRAKSKAVGKLVKAYMKSGRQFGIVDLSIEFPIKRQDFSDMKITFDPPAMFVVKATMDGCIDGSVNDRALKFAIRNEGQGVLTIRPLNLLEGEMKYKETLKYGSKGEETQKELAEK